MRALVYAGAGDAGVIQLREVPTPVPGEGQVLVRVHAAGLNRADILQRLGRYPAPPGWPADIPGLEDAGVVEALGPGVTRWRAGDRVMGLVGGGAQAEYVVVHQDEALAVPPGMELTDAAAIPEAYLTAWDALVLRGRLAAGERVLIHAVGSGVGTVAVQLGTWLGATVSGSSRTPAKLEAARVLGLTEAVDSGQLGPGGAKPAAPFDVIVDVFGAPAFAWNTEALAPRGRLVLLGFLQGARAELSLEPVLRKRLEIIGSVMRPRLLAERGPLVARFAAEVLPQFGARLRPVVGARYPMASAAGAHAAMEQDAVFGKIVLHW
ncbi:MAG: NAD(P)H-quinone oxidoreductase [Gemmatimonadetes bacterium]|nr:NAD(P)H-quinone oxidoreductase [Gemmatimonadota bacterium]